MIPTSGSAQVRAGINPFTSRSYTSYDTYGNSFISKQYFKGNMAECFHSSLVIHFLFVYLQTSRYLVVMYKVGRLCVYLR